MLAGMPTLLRDPIWGIQVIQGSYKVQRVLIEHGGGRARAKDSYSPSLELKPRLQ